MELKAKFNKTIARQIANKSFGHVLDCVLGVSDSGYNLETEVEEFYQNFIEDLEELGLIVTEKRLQIISELYKEEVVKLKNYIQKKYS